MDPSQVRSPPSAWLSAMALNSSPVQNASSDVPADVPTDVPTDASSPRSSLFDRTSPARAPHLAESPSPTPSPPNTPSPLDRRQSSNLNRSSLHPPRDDADLGETTVDIPCFVREPSLPYEAWETVFYAMLSSASCEEFDFSYGDVFENPATKKTLSTLRLVNRIWNQIATPLLFRYIQAVVGYSAGRPLDSILKISESPYAIYVRDVRFGFVGSWLPGLDYDKYIDDLASGALPILVSRFQNIQTLRLQTPSVVDTFSEDGQLPVPMLAKLTNALVHTLRFVPVPRLKCLHMSMPTTAEFARFFESNSYARDFTNVFAQIEELHIIINDSTGPDGRRDPKWPRSAIKTKYPLDRFAPYLVQLISYAKGIQTLTLDARTWFDVSDLEAETLTKLKRFRLEGVRIRAESLRAIFIQARSTLVRVELVHVRLMTGTWEDVFGHVALPPRNLSWLRLDGCGYSMTGASAHYVGYSYTHHPTALWTLHGRDWLALTHWRSVVNSNRRCKGLLPCPHCFFPAINVVHNHH